MLEKEGHVVEIVETELEIDLDTTEESEDIETFFSKIVIEFVII